MVDAMMMYGYLEEARAGVTTLLNPTGNLDRSIKGYQYRNGMSQYYAGTHARLSGDLPWLRSVSSQLINNSAWTAEQRAKGFRDSITHGLLPQRFYDSSDIQIPAYPLFSNIACWRGALDTATLLKGIVGPETAKSLQKEVDEYRAAIQKAICATINVSHGTRVPFTPTSLEIGGRQSLSQPRPPDEQPYLRLSSVKCCSLETKLGNYWILWLNMMMHLGLWQWTGSTDPWRGGVCNVDGSVNPSSDVLPAPLLTSWAEEHGGTWAGLPRFFYGLDGVYHGYIEHLIERSKMNITERSSAVAAVEAYMMHSASSNGYSVIEVSALYPRRMNHTLMQRDAVERPWLPYVTYDEYFQAEDGDSEPLGAGAGAGLVIIRRAIIDEGTTPPSPLPDGRLFLLSSTPSDFLTVDGPGIALKGVPTAYGLIDFAAVLPNRTTAVVRFACNPHAGGLSQALSQVIVRLVVPGLVPDATGQRWSLFDRQSIVIKPDTSAVALSIPLRVDRHPIKSDDDADSRVRVPRFSPDRGP